MLGLTNKESSVGSTSNCTSGPVAIYSDSTFPALFVIDPCAITASDSSLADKSTVMSPENTLSGGSGFVDALIRIIFWLIGQQLFFAEWSACQPFATSFSAVHGYVAHVSACITVLDGRSVLWSISTSGWWHHISSGRSEPPYEVQGWPYHRLPLGSFWWLVSRDSTIFPQRCAETMGDFDALWDCDNTYDITALYLKIPKTVIEL